MKEGNPHNSLVMLTPPIETTKPLSERKRKKGKKGRYVSTFTMQCNTVKYNAMKLERKKKDSTDCNLDPMEG